MSKNTTGKWILFVIAFIVSCLIWYMVITSDDPRINISLGDTQVELLNGDELHQNGFAYYVEENERIKVSVNVVQKRGWLINPSDIRLTADLSGVSEATAVLPVKSEVVSNQVIIGNHYKLSDNYVKIRTEKLVEQEVPISVFSQGEAEDNCTVGSCIPDQTSVKVKVPKSLKNTVASAQATVDISGRSADYEGEVALSFYDQKGNKLDCEKLQIFPETDSVSVKIPIGKTRKLSIANLQESGSCAKGYRCTAVTASRNSVMVLGPETSLEDMKEISLASCRIDLDGKKESFDLTVDLEDYLPSGVVVLDPDEREITISVTIERLERKTITFPASNIKIRNLEASLKATITTLEISAVIEGLPRQLEGLEADQVEAYLDLKDYKEGSYQVAVHYTLPKTDKNTAYKLISSDKVTVMISGL